MSRIGWVLVAVLSLLLIVGWYFLIFAPTSEDIEDTRAQTDQVLTEAQSQRQRAQALREIRQDAPEAEAQLAFGRTIIPDDPAIPALFRQIQQASDDAGARLPSISPSAPTLVDVDGQEIAAVAVTMNVEGSYFQLVDFARRVEDPTLTPRALRWQTASLSVGEYPTLNATFTGTVYARSTVDLPEPIEDEPEPEDAEPDDEADGEEPEAPEAPEPPPGADEEGELE